MRGAKLDPFSAKLLSIRTNHAKAAPARESRLLDKESGEPEAVLASTTDATPEAYEPPPLPYTPSRSAPDAPARSEAPVGAVTESVLSVLDRAAVAPTDCHTCGQHDAPEGAYNLRELTNELQKLKDRVSHLEYAAQVHGTDLTEALKKTGQLPDARGH